MKSDFLTLQQAYVQFYSRSLEKSKFSLLNADRKEFLIRNKYGKVTIELFFKLARTLGTSNLLECGANDASVSIRFINEVQGRSAVAYEANPFVFERYRLNNDFIAGLTYLQVGISDKKGYLDFHIPKVTDKSYSIFGSFQKLSNYYSDYETLKVKLDSLDNLHRFPNKLGQTAMWVDVEGEAFKLFGGSKKVLRSGSVQLIYVEVQEGVHYGSEKNATQISDYLLEFGFLPVARDFPLANLYNLVFIHEDRIHEVMPILNGYWLSLGAIKAPILEFRMPLTFLSRIKKAVIEILPESWSKYGHRIFAMLGSKSSRSISSMDS